MTFQNSNFYPSNPNLQIGRLLFTSSNPQISTLSKKFAADWCRLTSKFNLPQCEVVRTFHHKRSLLLMSQICQFLSQVHHIWIYLLCLHFLQGMLLCCHFLQGMFLIAREFLNATDSYWITNVDHSGRFVWYFCGKCQWRRNVSAEFCYSAEWILYN